MTCRIAAEATERMSVRVLSPRLRWREVCQAQEEADRLLADARQEAKALLRRAKTRVKAWRQEARAETEAGSAERLAECLAQVARWRTRLAQGNQQQLLELAVAMADRLLGEQLKLEPERIASICGQVIAESACQDQQLTIRLCPGDVEMAGSWLERQEDFLIEADESLSPGDCMITSPWGEVDARLVTRLDLLLKGLLLPGCEVPS
ncbi:MAG: hypothetical protein JRF33_01565 [Deltaproteobacteria bacterium]|nr:hypothetical protein [Deltaproteobacteria bacterium]